MSTQSELEALQTTAAIAPLNASFLRITGSDATRWLNGMVTNSIQSLAPGEGNYNFLLNAQGRIQGDCHIYRDLAGVDAPEFLLETDRAQVGAIQQHLDRFIIMDDVELLPVMDDQQGRLLAGPQSTGCLTSLTLPAPEPNRMARATYSGQPVLLLTQRAGVTELWAAPEIIAALQLALDASTVTCTSPDTLEHLRILEGTPRFGTDIRDRDLPQETAQAHALHFSKGCYLGQEIVERIHSRGQVHRQFTRFTLTGALPILPAPLTADGKPVGELTSAARIGENIYALGYARREALERNLPLLYDGGIASKR